jgi:hypothetical protein
VVALLFCPLGLTILFGISLMWVKSSAEGRPRPAGLGYAGLALASLVLAAVIWAIGGASAIYPELDYQCTVRDAGEFIDYNGSDLPLSAALVCSEETIELVPVWVNPLLFLLLAAVPGFLAAAYLAWKRQRVSGPSVRGDGATDRGESRGATALAVTPRASSGQPASIAA